jgi:Leucine-rich repeat (LRR) protein
LKILPSAGTFTTKDDYLQTLIGPIGSSNILPSTLNFELKLFTAVNSLSYFGIVPQNVTSCDPVRAKVVEFNVNFTRVQNIQQILVPELVAPPSSTESLTAYKWTSVKKADFGHNDIWTIDVTMNLMSDVEELHLNNNRLRTIANLSSLHNLRYLNLSGNIVESLTDWYMQLGNIESLNLSSNKLKSLRGLSRLRSIRLIDLSWNQIDDFDEIEEIALLPVVEQISLNGNPLILEVDWRSKVLARFEERCGDIVLDNEKCSPHELDKAMVFAALRKTRSR